MMAQKMTCSVHNIILLRCIALLCCLSTLWPNVKTQDLPDVDFEYVAYDPADSTDWRYTEKVLQDDQGFIWMATVNGLYRYDGRQIKPYFHSQDSTTISSNHVQELFEDSRGTLWLGHRQEGIDTYDRVHDCFTRITVPEIAKERVWDIIEDDEGKIWIGGRTGLSCYDYEKDRWEHFKVPGEGQIGHNVVRAVAQDKNDSNIFWLGTIYGLLSFDRDAGEFTKHHQPIHVRHPHMTPDDIMIMCLYQDIHGTLWAGTWSAGILSFHPEENAWTRYILDMPTPLDSDWESVVFDLLPKDENKLWAATSQGFGIFDLVSKQYTFYDPALSEIRNSFYYAGICISKDMRVLAGAFGGLLISEPMTNDTELAFPPVIVAIMVQNRDLTLDSNATLIKYAELGEVEQDISISVSTPGYFGPQPLIYNYKLEGYDQEWQTSDNPFFKYTNLRGGEYQFYYKFSTDAGITWTDGSTALTITKLIPLWSRPWFIAITALLLVIVIGFVYRMKIQAIHKTAELKHEYNKQLANVKMAALRAQMNPHFMFNSLNAINTYILKEETEAASAYLTKFSKLMRAVLRNSKSTLVPLSDELKALRLYIELEALRFDDEFQYSIEVDPDLDSSQIAFPPLLIQPYVENAIRHGLLEKVTGSRLLKVIIEPKDNHKLSVKIEDNGIGRAAAAAKKHIYGDSKKSYGMQITRDRIGLIEQTLDITTEVTVHDLNTNESDSTGTVVEVILPKLSVTENIFVND